MFLIKKLFLLSLLALITVFISYGTSFAESKSDGLTNKEIHVGQWGPLTGPAAAWGAVQRGTAVYLKMINETGGVNGRKIVHHSLDDSYDPAKTKAGVKQLQEEGVGIFAWIGGLGTSNGFAVMDYLVEKKVPWVFPILGSERLNNPPNKYIFTAFPQYMGQSKILVNYAVKTLGKKKIAICYQDDEYGTLALKAAQEALAALDLKAVAEIPMAVQEVDLKPHVMKLKESEAEVVMMWGTAGHGIRLLGTSKAMKFSPIWMVPNTLSDCSTMVTISKGLWTGVYGAGYLDVDENNPMIKKYKTIYEKYADKSEKFTTNLLAGFVVGEGFVEALKKAGKGKKLSRDSFIKALEEIKGYKGIFGEMNFKAFDEKDSKSRLGLDSVYIFECQADGSTKKISDWIKIE